MDLVLFDLDNTLLAGDSDFAWAQFLIGKGAVDREVQEAAVAALRLTADDLFVYRDVALTDTLAADLALQCRLKTIWAPTAIRPWQDREHDV